MNDQEKFQAAGDALLLMLDELGVERTSAICQEIVNTDPNVPDLNLDHHMI